MLAPVRLARAFKNRRGSVLIGLLVLGFVVYRSSGMINVADFSEPKLLDAIRHAKKLAK